MNGAVIPLMRALETGQLQEVNSAEFYYSHMSKGGLIRRTDGTLEMRRWPSWTTAASDVLLGDGEPSAACIYFPFRCQDDFRFALPFGPESKLSFCCSGLIKHIRVSGGVTGGFSAPEPSRNPDKRRITAAVSQPRGTTGQTSVVVRRVWSLM